MANENDPLFYLPSLGQYQRAQRDAQSAEVGGLLNKRLLASSYDFARTLGYKTPEERQIEAANKVMADAEMAETEVDPIDRQINVLAKAAKSFNSMGLTEYVQKIAPEISRLRNQKLEQIKLMADAEGTIAKTKETNLDAKLKTATFDSSVALAEAQAEAAGLGEDLWFNDSGQYRSVNEKSKADVALAKAKGFYKYKPGVGADKDLLSKKTAGDLQTSILDADRQLAGLQEIAHTFKPEYLNYEGKVKNWGANILEQVPGLDLSAKQAAELTGYVDFRRITSDAFSKYVHDLTGAQMSKFETDRIQKGFVNVDKDGPTAFKSKLRSTAKQVIGARKRAATYLANGGVVPKNPDGTLNGEIWNQIQLPEVSEAEVNAFLGPLAGEAKKPAHAYADPAKEAAYQEWLRTQP